MCHRQPSAPILVPLFLAAPRCQSAERVLLDLACMLFFLHSSISDLKPCLLAVDEDDEVSSLAVFDSVETPSCLSAAATSIGSMRAEHRVPPGWTLLWLCRFRQKA
jgi:hypothetical protein